jgi:hypothetical protein
MAKAGKKSRAAVTAARLLGCLRSPFGLAERASAPRQATTAAAAPPDAATAAAATADAGPQAAAAAATPATAAAAPTAAAATAAPAAAAAATATARQLKEGPRGFLVEHVERRQADVGDFFLTEREFVTRLDVPRRNIRCRASRLRRCGAAGQRQQSSGSQHGDRPAPTLSLRSLLRMQHDKGLLRAMIRIDNAVLSLQFAGGKCQNSQKLKSRLRRSRPAPTLFPPPPWQ